MKIRKSNLSSFTARLVCALVLLSGYGSISLSAQQTQPAAPRNAVPFPIIPVIVEYDYLPLYFLQWMNDDPHYSRITAAVHPGEPPVYQITLTERAGGDIHYCNSRERVEALRRAGKQAHFAAIDYRTTRNVGQPTTYGFGFRDAQGRAILWRFTPASRPSERGAGLTPQARTPGLRLMYRNLGTTAGEGTAVQIGDRVNEADPWPESSAPPYFIAYRGSHSEGMDDGALLTGSESWRVVSAPNVSNINELREGAQWTLREASGRERIMRVTTRRADEITITETNSEADATRLELTARITSQGFALRAVRLLDGTRSMRIAFTPELNLASVSSVANNADVGFEIDLGNQRRVAQGTVSVERQDGSLRLRWMPRSPDWARSRPLTSTIRTDAGGYMIEVSQAAGQSSR